MHAIKWRENLYTALIVTALLWLCVILLGADLPLWAWPVHYTICVVWCSFYDWYMAYDR